MDDSPATRQSLIVKLRDPADSGAWSEFVALYEPLVYRLARRKGLQDADARDLCQEVFRAVAGAVDRWDPAPRQLPRLDLSDRTQLDDQLPDSPVASLSRQRGDQRSRAARGPARTGHTGRGDLRS